MHPFRFRSKPIPAEGILLSERSKASQSKRARWGERKGVKRGTASSACKQPAFSLCGRRDARQTFREFVRHLPGLGRPAVGRPVVFLNCDQVEKPDELARNCIQIQCNVVVLAVSSSGGSARSARAGAQSRSFGEKLRMCKLEAWCSGRIAFCDETWQNRDARILNAGRLRLAVRLRRSLR